MDFQIVIDSLTKIVTDILNFIPNLINGLIILLIGFLIAVVIRWILATVLGRLKLDALVERAGLTRALRSYSIKVPPTRLVAQTIFFFLLLTFLITATNLMGLGAVSRLLEQLLVFLPNIIAALILFLLGGLVAQFVGNLVAAAATASGVTGAARLGTLVQSIITLFVVVLALSQLGVDTAILVTAITIMLAAFGLAVGLGLGLGVRSVVQHILAGYYMRQRLAAGQPIALNDVQGEVGGVGSVNTVVNTAEGNVIIPNTVLLESLVRAPRPPEPTPKDVQL
ncbi:MAG: mechanosensitive ion channel [Chloroflexaceae bacterium]|jgi:hypothetical protein|nr:mechanosensitive ion channel [Chloroflexaceae bacterium]